MEIEKKQIVDLMIATTKIARQCDRIDNAIGTDVFIETFGRELDTFTETILDLCGVPKEETPFIALGIETNGMNKSQIEYGFCRDNLSEKIFNIENLENDEDVELACDVFIVGTLERWYPDENYVTRREE